MGFYSHLFPVKGNEQAIERLSAANIVVTIDSEQEFAVARFLSARDLANFKYSGKIPA